MRQRAFYGISYSLFAVEDGNNDTGLAVELLFVEVDMTIISGVHQCSQCSQMGRGHLLHLHLHLAVARIYIVKLLLAALAVVDLFLGIEKLVEVEQVALSAQVEPKIVEGCKAIAALRSACLLGIVVQQRCAHE